MDYKEIVFDVDNTLIDTEYAILHSLQDTIKQINRKIIPIKELSFALGITGEDALRYLKIEDITIALSMWDRNMEKYKNTVLVFKEIKEMLTEIIKLNIGIGIVTSKTHEEFRNDFLSFDIAPYFNTVVCSNDTLEHKPKAVPLLKYMELTKCQNNELLYIGDSIYDMQCAYRANVDFGLVKWGSGDRVSAVISFTTPLDLIRQLSVSSN
ncbi:HAD family hydrolase [Clostridioides difficile]|uniref:HAD family hydrolase n=1 Tax=Clostridioides difficile TaxID=1496 RepID=UPI00038CACE9|nr:HAD family hydrolase [Clostridioides difficile]EGT3681712.1 HAD family hydrolase [Clostridioides difficile]EGT3807744.1 HAD family hydrolase [Clostridioides difficile]EGT3863246.1 HAD family hydrolase [Clostridioides difficile]EGT4768771.1 HAD family hydrolase [Clostridioides difficile]EGT4996239.1 HAD family hydrolase [Clostridioides difficile]